MLLLRPAPGEGAHTPETPSSLVLKLESEHRRLTKTDSM